MQDLWIALGLVMLLEGAIYALFPEKMIDMMRKLPDIPASTLRMMGISGVALGWLLIHFVRG
ncbi:MAG: DUF2065 domain-containing protein [Mariprofundaceae bacterium]|nr:DUF2065 domain-containing protein [Mariprofundaceae bacterium]